MRKQKLSPLDIVEMMLQGISIDIYCRKRGLKPTEFQNNKIGKSYLIPSGDTVKWFKEPGYSKDYKPVHCEYYYSSPGWEPVSLFEMYRFDWPEISVKLFRRLLKKGYIKKNKDGLYELTKEAVKDNEWYKEQGKLHCSFYKFYGRRSIISKYRTRLKIEAERQAFLDEIYAGHEEPEPEPVEIERREVPKKRIVSKKSVRQQAKQEILEQLEECRILCG